MNINLSLLGQMITFGIFVWFTMKFVWPPLMKAMSERRERIAEGLAAADRGKVQLEEAEQTVKLELADAKKQVADMLKDAERRAAGIVEDAKAKAREEGERLLEAAQQEVDQAYLSAREALIREVSLLSVKGAEKILQRSIDSAANEALVEDMIAELSHV